MDIFFNAVTYLFVHATDIFPNAQIENKINVDSKKLGLGEEEE